MLDESDNYSISKSAKDFTVGSIVFGKFEVLEFIASGGKGRVYKVRDVDLNNVVALKVLIVDSKSDKALVRFQSEAKTSSRLNHPNIATIYDFGFVDGTPYISMEFVDGETLDTLCAREEKITLQYFLEIFIQVCQGLLHAHNQGVVHRDLKPDNIVVRTNTDGTISAKILDFGLAKRVDLLVDEESRQTPTGNIVGSPLFMSPEQGRGAEPTRESDLYSLGCTMWFCLTGQAPLRGDTAIDTIIMHQQITPPPLGVAFADLNLPIKLTDCVDRLINKDPAERPSLNDVVLANLLILQDSIYAAPKAAVEIGLTTGDTGQNDKRKLLVIVPVAVMVLGIVLFLSLPNFKTLDTSAEIEPISGYESTLALPKNTIVENEFAHGQQKEQGEKDLQLVMNCTDKKVKARNDLGPIESINFSDSPVTDKVFEYLQKATNLQKLRLKGTAVTTLKGISLLPQVNLVDLQDTEVTDSSIDNMAGMQKLTELSLAHTRVTDAVFPKLAKLSGLMSVNLTDTRVTCAGSSSLSTLKNLHWVRLDGCDVTMDGISELASQTRAGSIDIEPSKSLSLAEIMQLKKQFPCVSFGKHGGELATLAKNAKIAHEQGRYRDAKNLYGTCIDLLRKHRGKDYDGLAPTYFAYADSAEFAGDRKSAMDALDKAVSLARRLSNNRLLIEAFDQQSGIALRSGDFKAAEPMLLKAHKLAEEVLPVNNFEQRCFAFGEALKNMKHYGRALSYLQQCLELRKKLFGAESEEVGRVLTSIGDCQRGIGQSLQAYNSYKKSLTILERKPLKKHDSLMAKCYAYGGIAQIENENERFDRAIANSDKAYKLLEDPSFPPSLRGIIIMQRITILTRAKRSNQLPKLKAQYDELARVHQEVPKRLRSPIAGTSR